MRSCFIVAIVASIAFSLTVQGLTPIWNTGIYSLLICDGMAFETGTAVEEAQGLDSRTGNITWTAPIAAGYRTPNIIFAPGYRAAFFVIEDGLNGVSAYKTSTGQSLWNFTMILNSKVYEEVQLVAFPQHDIIVIIVPTSVIGVNITDGREVWQFYIQRPEAPKGSSISHCASNSSCVVVSIQNSSSPSISDMAVIDVKTGRVTTPWVTVNNLSVVGNRIITSTYTQGSYTVSAASADGDLIWTVEAPFGFTTGDANTWYSSGHNASRGVVLAFSTESGDSLWIWRDTDVVGFNPRSVAQFGNGYGIYFGNIIANGQDSGLLQSGAVFNESNGKVMAVLPRHLSVYDAYFSLVPGWQIGSSTWVIPTAPSSYLQIDIGVNASFSQHTLPVSFSRFYMIGKDHLLVTNQTWLWGYSLL